MSEYTPTTEEVRIKYFLASGVGEMAKEEFDQWLSSHDAIVRAEAEAEIHAERDAADAIASEAGDTPWDDAVARFFDPIYDAKLNEVMTRYFDTRTVAEIKEQIRERSTPPLSGFRDTRLSSVPKGNDKP